ncbi:polysaccharide deacetylase family protein [Natrinema sp. 1APR25-10V2]|uniref:polysaccharide deacetylase family protein n=1 Tax=Natrinema sp. 1APR25-10V2 TaxID=2951081 RepID=UPI002876629A|nr:polysaccharide deacetylase family protein [Natrinema sp. 1APR25-10V2]MDS0473388.1 polysaccharide deacetylase family protein [Natrinema sp. 1APR25-10V2]
MESERDTDDGRSRRRLLTALGAASTTAIAGCTDVLSDDETGAAGPDDGTARRGSRESGSRNGATDWPAIGAGDVLSDFEDLEEWSPRSETADLSAAPDEAQTGSQAAVVESDEGRAGMEIRFSDGIDLEGWDISLAVKPESADRIAVEFLAPTRSERLASVRPVPDAFDGWFRMDCGFQQKPGNEPDLTAVTGINVVAHGPDGGPTRLLVDDLRRTESAAAGAAILSFHGGHQSHYDVAAEMLAERGWAAAVPVTPERIGDAGRMGREELRELRDRGWDVCSLPQPSTPLPEQSADRQREVLEGARDALENAGFEDGARHLFVPDGRMDATTYDVARDVHESAFLYSAGTTGVPPTEMHMIPYIWGPALHTGVRRHANHSDQYGLLTVLRVPRLVDADDVGVDENRMSLDDFGLLLDHLEHRGLDVVTPSALVDEEFERADGSDEPTNRKRPSGVVLEAGQSYAFEGSGPTDSQTFDLDDGVVVADVSNDGSSIAVDVTDTDGSGRSENLLTTSGNATGESIAAVETGTYELEIDADGAWSIELSQPAVRADELSELPVQASGTGSAFVGPLWTEGDVRVEATHDGDGRFVVDGHGADGSREILVHRDGSFDNSRSYKAGGVVWLNVEADGDWTLEVVDA